MNHIFKQPTQSVQAKAQGVVHHEPRAHFITASIAGIPVKYQLRYNTATTILRSFEVRSAPVIEVGEQDLDSRTNTLRETEAVSADLAELLGALEVTHEALISHNCINMHAALLELDGQMFVLTGTSGVGKSTQARIWQEHLGATIVNSDKPFLRYIHDAWWGASSPWTGAEGPLEPGHFAPLAGICFLEQAEDNSIRRLSSDEASVLLLKQVIMPADPCTATKLLNLIDHLSAHVPIFLLKCTPTPEAAQLAYEKLADAVAHTSIHIDGEADRPLTRSSHQKAGIVGGRHAYLIMAHQRPDLLGALIAALDHERNDLYIHIDLKADASMDESHFHAGHARLHFVKRRRVTWAAYSQIDCTLHLLEIALADGKHDFYHFMSGADYPLKRQQEILSFFDAHKDTEFISCDDAADVERLSLYWPMSDREKSLDAHISERRQKLRRTCYRWQKRLHIDRFRRFKMEAKKGLAYWHITQACAEYVQAHKRLIRKMTRFSVSGDELFLQTLVWSSPFRERLYTNESGITSSLYETTWPLEDAGAYRISHSFISSDLNTLLTSKALFARKFEGPDGAFLIHQIKHHLAQEAEARNERETDS